MRLLSMPLCLAIAAAATIAACAPNDPIPTAADPGGLVNVVAALSGPRGRSADHIADVEVGQRDFTELAAREIVPDKLNQPGGIVIDKSVWPGRAYIWDSGNSRILGIDLARCYARPAGQRCAADLIFGQSSGSDHGACNRDASAQQYPLRPAASASTVCGVWERTHTTLEDKSFANMTVDSSGNLYVPDIENNRVLKYLSPFTTDVIADDVWGQPDFTKDGCNGSTDPSQIPAPSASTLCLSLHISTTSGATGGAVRFDASGNLWVVDGGNNRVLRYPRLGNGTMSKTANLVLGQPDFVSAGGGGAMNQMSAPQALLFDGSWNLYVADPSNNRVLIFQRSPSTGDFVSGASAVSTFPASDASGPTSLEIDPDSRGVWTLGNTDSGAVMNLWDWNGALITSAGIGFPSGGSIAFDGQRSLLVTSYGYGQDVHHFTRSSDGLTYTQDRQLYSPPGGYNLASARRFEHPAGGGVTVIGQQLVVSDGRLMFWNNAHAITNGQTPDGYVGASSATEVAGFSQIKSTATHVWAIKNLSGSEIRVYNGPLVQGAAPIKTITTVPVLNSTAVVTFSESDPVLGLAPTPNEAYLWVAQTYHNRVMRIRGPLGANPIVDVILGQVDAVGGDCNRDLIPAPNTLTPLVADRSMLCFPAALAIDRKGDLFVSDHTVETQGNWRMLMFAPSLFPAAPATTLYAPFATKEFPKNTAGYIPRTFEPAFDSTNRMVVGLDPYVNPRFVQYFNDPTLLNPANPSDPAFAAPSGELEDFTGWVMANAFDSSDNLYSFDANRGRVNIYLKPFGP